MTSRNAQKLQYSDAANVDNAMINHKHHRRHDSPVVYPTEVEFNPEKPLQQLPVKHKHRHEHKVNVDGPYDVQNHPIQSISGLLRTERHHSRKSKMYSTGEPKLYSNAAINMNHLCENCHLPKLSESGENSKNITSDNASKYKDAQKFFNTKSSTSKHVQTSKTKLKQKRARGDEVKHYQSKSTISRNVVGKSKKEIYIITGEDTLFKFTTLSQEHVHSKHKRQLDRKGLLPIETKLEGDASINMKPANELASQGSTCVMARSQSSSEFLKTAEATDKNLSVQHKPPAVEEKNRHGNDGPLKDNEMFQDGKSEIAGVQENTRHPYGKYRERHSNQQEVEGKKRRDKYDYPKVVSTKLKHRQKKSDVTLTDRTKSSEERLHKRHKREHRHKHSKNNDFALPLANACTDSKEKLAASKDITTLLHSDLSNDELEFRRKRILDNIEKAYSKHKHILPKEVVDALDGNIKQWRNMDLEASKKSSDQMSNVLDLEEVLRKNKKSKLHFREHHSEKITTTASESTLPSGFKKTFKPQNDLILLNAIVTGINNIDCDKDTVHVNKIPKFVRLEEIVCEPDTMASKRVLSKISVMQKCVSDPKDPLDNYSHGAIPKIGRALATPIASNEDMRKEVSFSQLNVQPTISQYSVNTQNLNNLNGFLPSILGDKRFSKSKKKKSAEKDLLNLFMKKDSREHKKLSKISIDPIVKFANDDSMFNVDGVEPPKKHKPNIPSVFIPRKNTPDMKKLELVVLPVLEISSRFGAPQTFNDAALSTSTIKLFNNTDAYVRKKENHRIQKTPRLSASSSESTIQLMNLPNGPIKAQLISEKSKRESELKKHYMSDKEAIEALKYLPLHQRECNECSSRSSYSKKKLEKIILSTVEIKSEIPAENVKSGLTINRKKSSDRGGSKVLNRLESKARTLIPSKETEFLLKSNQDIPIRVLDPQSDRLENAIAPLNNLLNEKSLEDYVTKDKYEERKPDKRGSIIPCLNLNVCKKSNHSICSSVDDKSQSKKPMKTSNVDSGRVRTRMLNYSRNVEQRRKYSRGSTGSSRDTSNEGDNNSGPPTLTTVFPNATINEESTKKRPPSVHVFSTSSGISLNSESDKLSEKLKSKKRGETKIDPKVPKAAKNSTFATPNESADRVNPASEAISAALTKITEETISQDTLNGSDFSHYSKKETESKLPKAKVKPDKPPVKDKNVKPISPPVKKFESLVHPKKSDTSSTKSGRIPRHVDLSPPSTAKPKLDGSVDRRGTEANDKKVTTRLDSKLVLNTNASNIPKVKEENKNPPTKPVKTEEMNVLTESVKKIINEMQAINATNIQTMIQLIMNKKEETNKSGVDEILAKNLENALKKNALGDQIGDKKIGQKNLDMLRALTRENISGDYNLESTIKPSGDVSDCGSTKSSRSRKSDRTNYSIRSTKILENKNFGFRKRKPSSLLKVPSVRGCSTESQQSDNTQSNAPSSSVEHNLSSLLKPKTKYVSKLARSIPRSVLNKEQTGAGKPVSAPSGFDRNKTSQKFKSFSPSIDSDTRTSLISTRIGSAKEGSRQMFASSKASTTLSKFEKRKQYGESLRKKIKNDIVLPANHDSIYNAAGSNLADGDNVVSEPIEEKPGSQENSSCNYPIQSGLLDVQGFIEDNVACVPTDNDNQQPVDIQNIPELPNEEDGGNVDVGLSVPTFIKSVKSQTWLNNQSPNVVDETKPKEMENIYQTFTVMADHPHIIDVFRNKFRRNASSCVTDKENFYSPLSRFSINAYERNACSRHTTDFLELNESENLFQPLEKVKSLMSYSKEFQHFEEVNNKKTNADANESELAFSYEFCNSSPEVVYSTKSNPIDHSLTHLNKLSRMKINILEACQHLCKNDEGKQKYILYSPYTCSRKNTKLAEKDYSLPTFHKDDLNNNLHRCKHKFNIHSMLKINRTADDSCKWYCDAHGIGSDQAGIKPKHVNSSSKINNGKRNLPVRASRFVHRSDHNTQGNYVVFKIDKKLQLRQQNDISPKDTSRECFKIFMNNNLHNMQWDSDYPLRFSNYDFKSKLFYHNNYSVNQHPLSENGESGYDSSDGKENRNMSQSLSKEIDTAASNNPWSTVITFPFNLNQTSKSKDAYSSKILSAERDNEVVISVNDSNSSSLPKSRIEQLCESVTNLYNSLDTNTSVGYRRVDFTSTSQYNADTSAYFYNKDDKHKHEREASSNRCNQAHCSKYEKPLNIHRSGSQRKTSETNTEVAEKSKAIGSSFKNTQTAEGKRQGSSEHKKNCRKHKVQTDDSTDYDTSKHNDKLTQTNIKRKHKKVTPELTSRSTSYDSIIIKEEAPVAEPVSSNRPELLDLLSNPVFAELVTTTIKNILVDAHVLPTHSSEELLKSIVQESISSMKKEADKVSTQPLNTADKSNGSQTSSNKDPVMENVNIEIIAKNTKDLELQLATNLSLKHNDSFNFEEFIRNLLSDVIQKIVDIKQSCKFSPEVESKTAFHKIQETALDFKTDETKIKLYNNIQTSSVPSANVPPRVAVTNAASQTGKFSDHENNLFSSQEFTDMKLSSHRTHYMTENTLPLNKKLSYETENISVSYKQKINEIRSPDHSNNLQKNTVSSDDSMLSPLSVEEKQSLVSDLKSFKNVLSDLSRSIAETQSEEQVLEYCSLRSSKWKLINKTTLRPSEKHSASSASEKRLSERSSSIEVKPIDLLTVMSKLPLSNLISLYKKVSERNNPEITFELLIQELYEAEAHKLKNTNEGGSTEKTEQTNASPDDSEITMTKIKNLNQKQKQENNETFIKIQLTASLKSYEKEQKQVNDVKKNKMSGTQEPDNEKPGESGKLSHHDTIKKIPKKEESNDQSKINQKPPEPTSNELSSKSKKRSDKDKKTLLSEVVLSLTDKQIFSTLLDSFEKEETLVYQLTSDNEFLKSQLETVKNKDSVEYFLRHSNGPEDKSFENVMKELEDIVEETESTPKMNKPEVNALKKVPSKFSTIKSKMSRLFRSNSHEFNRSGSSNRQSSIDEFVGKGGKIQYSKTGILDRYKREESSLSSNDSNFVKPQEVGRYFMRGFREDQMLLDGASSSKAYDRSRDDLSLESYIELSERDNPLDYLLALGYSIEEASRAIEDEDVENRLNAAVIEARIWVNQVTKTQGTLLYVLAYKAKPNIMRYYLQLIEAIINNRIDNVVKLDSFLKVLEKVEEGDISMLYILGSNIFEEEENEEYLLKKQLRKVFHDVYRIAENEATLRGKELTKNEVNLLKILSAKYRSGLPEHLEIIAQYIGRGSLRSQVQLDAAMIYFSRLDSSEFHVAKFEKYCGIKSKE